MSLRLAALLAALSLTVAAPPSAIAASHYAARDTVSGMCDGVGEGPHSRLRFFFEVTFMKIDIAWVEAYLDPVAAADVERAVASVDTRSDGLEPSKWRRSSVVAFLTPARSETYRGT